jgi:hypothetical protein
MSNSRSFPGRRAHWRHCLVLSPLLSISLAMSGLCVPMTAEAAGRATVSLGSLSWHFADESAAVLTLDGDDSAAAERLTVALRRAFAKRGVGGSHDMSLVELRLTMGCDDDEPTCLASGGKTLGVRRLVYGYLRSSGSGYKADVRILEVDAGAVDRSTEIPVSKADLSPANIDGTATRIVNNLLPGEDSTDPPPRTASTPAEYTEPGPPIEEDKPPRERNVWFGLEKPTPGWKWAGFGVSLGLAVASGVAAAVLFQQVSKKEDELRVAADESLMDDNRANDVNRDLVGDLCVAARHPNPTPTEPEAVTNARMTRICNQADGLLAGTHGALAGVAVFGVSTLVFTGLLFIHRNKPGGLALKRRGFTFGAGPTVDGGISIASSVKF